MKEQSKKYYYDLQCKEVEKILQQNIKPSLLMHTCCAVCAAWPVQYLAQYFDLTLYFNNDNIYPESEYDKRFYELERYINLINEKYNFDIKIIKTPFKGKEYLDKIAPLKDEPEGGARCILCYDLRMDAAMKFASENNYDYFTTVMTISRQKDSKKLNQIGEHLQEKYPDVKYFYSDFKKDGGIEKGNAIVKEYGIYRQNYCGCLFSYQEMLERIKKDYYKSSSQD